MKYLFIFIIKLYKRLISPFLPSACRFYPTCSEYSIEAFQKHGAIKGFILAAFRILRCNPYCQGGIDHVPESFKLFSRKNIHSKHETNISHRDCHLG